MTADSFIAWRKRLGLTKIEAARRIGVGRNTIHAYETGKADIPLYVSLACAALAFGLPPQS